MVQTKANYSGIENGEEDLYEGEKETDTERDREDEARYNQEGPGSYRRDDGFLETMVVSDQDESFGLESNNIDAQEEILEVDSTVDSMVENAKAMANHIPREIYIDFKKYNQMIKKEKELADIPKEISINLDAMEQEGLEKHAEEKMMVKEIVDLTMLLDSDEEVEKEELSDNEISILTQPNVAYYEKK